MKPNNKKKPHYSKERAVSRSFPHRSQRIHPSQKDLEAATAAVVAAAAEKAEKSRRKSPRTRSALNSVTHISGHSSLPLYHKAASPVRCPLGYFPSSYYSFREHAPPRLHAVLDYFLFSSFSFKVWPYPDTDYLSFDFLVSGDGWNSYSLLVGSESR